MQGRSTRSRQRAANSGAGASSALAALHVEVLPFPAFIIDRHGALLAMNQGYRALMQAQDLGPSGRAAHLQALTLAGQPLAEQDVPGMRALRGERTDGALLRHLLHDGSTLVVRTNAAPIHDHAGNIQGALVTLQDVTAEIMQRRAAEAVALLASALAQGGNVDALLDCLLRAMEHLLQEPCQAMVWMVTEHPTGLRLAAARNVNPADISPHFYAPDAPIMACKAYRERRILVASDLQEQALSPESAQLARRLQLRASVFVPLVATDRVLGVLTASLSTPHRYHPAEIEAIVTIRDQFSMAIARLRTEEDSLAALTWLRSSGELLLACHDMDALLECTGNLLRQGLGIDRVHISISDRRDGSVERIRLLEARERAHRAPEVVVSLEQAMTWPWAEALVRGDVPYVIARLPLNPWQPEPDPTGATAVLLTVAIPHQGQLIGALHVAAEPDHSPLGEELVPLLSAFVQMLALALATVRLLEAQQRAIDDLDVARRQEEIAATHAAARAAQLDVIISSMGEGVILYDAQRVPIMMNEMAKSLLHVESPTDVLQPYEVRYPQGGIVPDAAWPSAIALTGTVFNDELLVGPPHRQRLLRIICSPLRDQSGQLLGAVSVLHDVTEERRANRAREDFAATASHEMRTPLTSIIGFLELVVANWDTLADQRRYEMTRRALTSAHRLDSLVQNLLLVSRFDAGRDGIGETLHVEPMVLADMVQRLCSEIAANYRQDAVRIRWRGPRFEVRWPALPIERVLTNLLDNAAKYSPRGGLVTITWVVRGDEMILRVRDHGAGVPPANRDRLFTRFGRLGNVVRAGRTGTGLGLYISRELITRMKGTIAYHDAPGGGACMVIQLPIPA